MPNEIPKGWKLARVDAIAEIVGGGTPSRSDASLWGGDIPWATPTDITSLRGRFLEATASTISRAGLDTSSAKLLPEGAVLMTTRATIGACAIARRPIATNQGFQNLVPKPGLQSEFLLYLMQSKSEEMERLAAGSTFLEISKRSVSALEVLVPPLAEQRKIAAILSSVDETIEKTEAVIAQLDVVKKAMLEELLSVDTAPDVTLVDVCRRITDGEHKTPTRTTTGILLLSARNVRDGDLSLADVDYVPPEEFQRMKGRCHPEAGDVLLSCSGSIGRAARVPDGLTFGLVRSVALIKPDPRHLTTAYLEQVLRSARLQRQMDETKKQAAQANLFIGAIEKLRIPLPKIAEQERIAGVLDAVDLRIRKEQQVCQALRGSKTAMSAALLSGDLRVVGDGEP